MLTVPAPDLQEALTDEHERLVALVVKLRDRAERLRALTDQAEAVASQEERHLREFEGLLGLAPQLRIETLNRRLRGQRLREVAIAILEQQGKPGQAIHYKDWYELLRSAGHTVGGQDPVATFLAQVSRASEVERVAPRSGLYRLRAV